MLGDSYTFGYGVELEDTFSKKLENLLVKDGYFVEVINGGVVSYSPILEYFYIKENGLDLKPDIIILNFDMSDIVDDYLYNSSAFHEDDEIVGFDVDLSKKERKEVNIFLKSRVVQLVKKSFEGILGKLFESKILKEDEIGDLNKDRLIVLRDDPGIDLGPYWNLTLSYIKRIDDISRENDITFILHVYPYGVQVNGDEWGDGRSKWGFLKGRTYNTEPFEILKSLSEENNIIFWSSLEKLKKNDDKYIYFSHDGHFNENGHLLIANFFHDELIEKNFIQKSN